MIHETGIKDYRQRWESNPLTDLLYEATVKALVGNGVPVSKQSLSTA